jgi:hypothetical protein
MGAGAFGLSQSIMGLLVGPRSAWITFLVVAASLASAGDALLPETGRSAAKHPRPWLPEDTPAQCLFLPKTAIPMLAMGVRRIEEDPAIRDRRLLDLWKQPSDAESGGEPLARVPLFRPLYVYASRPEAGVTWHLLGDAYVGSPRGWADARQLHVLESRYGYYFDNPKRVPPGVHLYESRPAAYAALEAQSRVPPQTLLDGVIVAERLGLKRLREENWNPQERDGVPPFVELADRGDAREMLERGLTDTTLTFSHPRENRLIRLGAVAGGPIDVAEVAKKKSEAAERAGVAIVFVIDETVSMKKYFPEVADFIGGNLKFDERVNSKVAVSWYSDVEKEGDVPYDVHPLEQLNGPGVLPADAAARKAKIVDAVRDHKWRVTKGKGAQERELIYQGVNAAIVRAGFQPGENAMVFVIGDAADRSTDKELVTQQNTLRDLIQTHKLQVAFVQVGESGADFVNQATAFRNRLPAGLRESVLVRSTSDSSLENQLADLQAQMEQRRARLLVEVAEMETRNHYSQPGSVLGKAFEAAGIDRADFDRLHLQFFTPAWGWLYHPQIGPAAPQLRELVWLAEAETAALVPALALAVNGLKTQGRIDLDATREKFAAALAQRSGHTAVAAALDEAWRFVPPDDRTFGRFLRDGLGLRVRNALLFHRGEANPQAKPTRESVQLLLESRTQLGASRPAGIAWLDAWKVVP